MADKKLSVIATVTDRATAPLKKIKEGFSGTADAVKKTGVNLTEFNRIMFSTTAFVGMFSKAMGSLGQSLAVAGDLDRLSTQFDRVVGPRGELFQQISGMTSNTIDKMEAMRAGIALKSTGITGNVSQMAKIIAQAGTAAKRAGLISAEGIKRVTDFMKDGSVSSLSFLNVLTPTNSALQAQMAILGKAGGVMGTVLSTQAKLRMGMAALDAAAAGMNKDTKDLSDNLQDLEQNFTFLKGSLGSLLGKALTPIFTQFSKITTKVTEFIDRIMKADNSLFRTIKNIIIVTGALAGLLATLGSLNLAAKALTALGVGGIPFVAAALLGLAASFSNVEASVEPFTSTLKKVSSVLVGVFQLVSSFLGSSDNFNKGIGQMDGELANFLRKNGLLELTTDIARFSAATIKFVQDAGQQLLSWFREFTQFIKPITKIFSDFMVGDKSNWSRSWIEGLDGIRGAAIKAVAGFAGLYAGWKLLKAGGGFLSKIPGLGGMFGATSGFGKGPKGTAQDPIHVVSNDNLSATASLLSKLTGPISAVPVATTVAAATGAGIAGYEIGKYLNENTEVIKEYFPMFTSALSVFGDLIGSWFNLDNSQTDKKNQELQQSAVYSRTADILKKYNQPMDVENVLRATRGVLQNATEISNRNPNAGKEFGVTEALSNLSGGLQFNQQTKADLSPYAIASSIIGTKRNQYGEAVTPMPSNPDTVTQDIKDVIAGIDKQAQQRVTFAWQEAMKGTSAGGKEITAAEYQAIMTAALDQSLITRHTKETANKRDPSPIASTRC